mgnify:CR=1 FL=1
MNPLNANKAPSSYKKRERGQSLGLLVCLVVRVFFFVFYFKFSWELDFLRGGFKERFDNLACRSFDGRME